MGKAAPSIALLLRVGMIADALVDNGNGKHVARFVPRPSANGARKPGKKAGRMHGATLKSPRLARLLAVLDDAPDGIPGPVLANKAKIAALSTAISELRAALRSEGDKRTVTCKLEKGKEKGERIVRYSLSISPRQSDSLHVY